MCISTWAESTIKHRIWGSFGMTHAPGVVQGLCSVVWQRGAACPKQYDPAAAEAQLYVSSTGEAHTDVSPCM